MSLNPEDEGIRLFWATVNSYQARQRRGIEDLNLYSHIPYLYII
jgi:hypothetical protein